MNFNLNATDEILSENEEEDAAAASSSSFQQYAALPGHLQKRKEKIARLQTDGILEHVFPHAATEAAAAHHQDDMNDDDDDVAAMQPPAKCKLCTLIGIEKDTPQALQELFECIVKRQQTQEINDLCLWDWASGYYNARVLPHSLNVLNAQIQRAQIPPHLVENHRAVLQRWSPGDVEAHFTLCRPEEDVSLMNKDIHDLSLLSEQILLHGCFLQDPRNKDERLIHAVNTRLFLQVLREKRAFLDMKLKKIAQQQAKK